MANFNFLLTRINLVLISIILHNILLHQITKKHYNIASVRPVVVNINSFISAGIGTNTDKYYNVLSIVQR